MLGVSLIEGDWDGIDEGYLEGCSLGMLEKGGSVDGSSLGWDDGSGDGRPEVEGVSEGRSLGSSVMAEG